MSSRVTAVTNGRLPSAKRQRVEDVNGTEKTWRVKASRESIECINPVRSCEEIYFKEALEERDKSKELIKVSIGERRMWGERERGGGGRERVRERERQRQREIKKEREKQERWRKEDICHCV